MIVKLAGILLLLSTQVASAAVTAEVLKFRTFAAKEMDKHREATGLHSAARVRVMRAEYQLDLRTRLFKVNATTAWDVSDASKELAGAKIMEGRTRADLDSAHAMEQVWKFFAEDVENGTDHKIQIAELLVTSRRAYQMAAQIGVDNIKIISREVNYQYQSAAKLVTSNAISKEEFFDIEVAADEAGHLVIAAEDELKAATENLEQAERDLDAVRQSRPAP